MFGSSVRRRRLRGNRATENSRAAIAVCVLSKLSGDTERAATGTSQRGVAGFATQWSVIAAGSQLFISLFIVFTDRLLIVSYLYVCLFCFVTVLNPHFLYLQRTNEYSRLCLSPNSE